MKFNAETSEKYCSIRRTSLKKQRAISETRCACVKASVTSRMWIARSCSMFLRVQSFLRNRLLQSVKKKSLILGNPDVHFCIHTRPLRMTQLYASTLYIFKIHTKLILVYMLKHFMLSNPVTFSMPFSSYCSFLSYLSRHNVARRQNVNFIRMVRYSASSHLWLLLFSLCCKKSGGWSTLQADSHKACRAHVVPLPCRAAKGLECVFPIWFTQCGRVWFTLVMPCPSHAPTMPFFSRPQHGRR
jgi:hypothetical protein